MSILQAAGMRARIFLVHSLSHPLMRYHLTRINELLRTPFEVSPILANDAC
jgi:hypothetical protein